jgi:hypothetical protein
VSAAVRAGVRVGALAAAVVVVVVGGCRSGLDAVAPVQLAETTPGLLQSAGAVVITFSTQQTCRTLVDAPVAELAALLAAEPDAPRQRIPMLRGAVDDDRDGVFDGEVATHTFARVPPNVPVAFLVLAVTRDPGRDFTIDGLAGSVFAIGCRTLTTSSNTNVGLPIVLAPAGLR